LDLRNNPGGYLTDAQFIAGEFLPVGQTVVWEDDGTVNRKSLNVDRTGLLTNTDIKLVILINKGSASASEIVAGAMRDNKRQFWFGETSYGKGTIQAAEDLGDGAGLHVTIAKWLTPNGTWVNGKGLTPDVSVNLDAKDPSRDTQLESAVSQLLNNAMRRPVVLFGFLLIVIGVLSLISSVLPNLGNFNFSPANIKQNVTVVSEESVTISDVKNVRSIGCNHCGRNYACSSTDFSVWTFWHCPIAPGPNSTATAKSKYRFRIYRLFRWNDRNQ